MVKNKKIGGLSGVSTKKGASQTARRRDQTPLEEPANRDTPPAPPEPEPPIAGQRQQGFPDRVYLLASAVFQNYHLEKPAAQRLVNYGEDMGLRLPEVKDEEMQQTAYQLAFNALKYQELLEEVMICTRFFLTHRMPDDQMSLVAVMLYDFQDRKFLPRERKGKEEIIQEVRDVENVLLRLKTKLSASLARFRVKHNLLSIECFLPESVKKKQEMAANVPLYAWVNTLKSSLDEVQRVLRDAGFSQVKSVSQLEGQTFCQDPHCGDTLVFPAQLKDQLRSTKLLRDHKLILQDKSCSLAPNAACCLLPEEGDVLLMGCFSGLTASHTAVLAAQKHKGDSSYRPTVYACVNDFTDAQREELQLTLSTMGCQNVKMIQEVFQSLDSGDKRLQKVRVVLLIPRCSMSAVSNPVEFILQENGDTDLLRDLSRGAVAQSKLESLIAQQKKAIDHALKLPMVLAVVYSTCSSYPEENVDVVKSALQKATACSHQEGKPKQAKFRPSPSPFSLFDHGDTTEETEAFFVLEPSKQSSGCFLAVLIREPEQVIQETSQEVLARANAKGILDRIGSNGSTNTRKKTGQAHGSQPHLSVRTKSKNRQTKGSNGTVLCGHHAFQQTSAGKPKAPRLHATSSSFSFSKTEGSTPAKLTTSTTLDPARPPPNHVATSSSFSFSKTEGSTPAQLTTSTTLDPARPPPNHVAPVCRPCRAQLALKPVVLVLPPVRFPNGFPPRGSQTVFSPRPGFNRWTAPAPLSSRGPSKEFNEA